MIIFNPFMFYKNPSVAFPRTAAYKKVREFLFKMDLSIKNNPKPTDNRYILDELIKIQQIIEETQLSSEPSRYANKAMIDVITQIEEISDNLYLKESFGNKIRMDYGTGHELNFLIYLYYISEEFNVEFYLDNLWFYMGLVEKFIRKFNVEPAGARGCWSLNDYTLLGLVFGSSINELDPDKTENDVESSFFYFKYRDMWLNAMKQTNKNNKFIELVEKTQNQGNIYFYKMYVEDILNKHVVTQHFIFSDKLTDEIL